MSIVLRLLAGPVFEKVVDLVKDLSTKQLQEDEIEARVKAALIKASAEIAPHQADVVKAEISGESWLQRHWRPLVSITFGFIVAFYALVVPIAVDWFGLPPVRIGDKLLEWVFTLTTIALGGYIGGRTAEKITEKILRR